MLGKDNRDYIYMIWKEPNTRRNYVVGELSRNGQYEFRYGHEINEAIKNGFEPLISFQDINKVYVSDILFPTFASRLPDRKRRGLQKILAKYDLDEYDAYKLLKRSGARLPIDNLHFIDPIFEESNSENVKRIFHIAGARHCIECEGEDCNKSTPVEVGEPLQLQLDPENDYDENAIKIIDSKHNILGFVPRYYSAEMTKFIKQGILYDCKVIEVNKNKIHNCSECIKVKLEVYFSTSEEKS